MSNQSEIRSLLLNMDNVFEWNKCFENKKMSDDYLNRIREFMNRRGVGDVETVLNVIDSSFYALTECQKPLFISFCKKFIFFTLKNILSKHV